MTAKVLSQQVTQDSDTGDMIRTWAPRVSGKPLYCAARGVVSKGTGGGTTETFTSAGVVETSDYVRIQFDGDESLNARDRITEITSSEGIVLWREEETDDSATIFDVLGVTPTPDPWGQQMEQTALLQRSDAQNG
jgi:hypothetical protein